MKAVKEVMRTNVPTISPEDPVRKATKTMRDNNVWGLPVVDEGKIEGIITDGDILNAFYLGVSVFSYEENVGRDDETKKFRERIEEFRNLKVRDVMTLHPRTISDKAGVDEAAAMLKRFKIKRLIAVDEKGKLVGLVERLNVVDSILSE